MTEPRLYAAAACANKHIGSTYTTATAPFVLGARDEKAAQQIVILEATTVTFPLDEGWRNHQVSVMEITGTMVASIMKQRDGNT